MLFRGTLLFFLVCLFISEFLDCLFRKFSVICYICSLSKWRVLSLRFLLCLNGPLSFCHRLDYLESIVLRQEKSTDITQRILAACILGYFRAITTAVTVAGLCGLVLLKGSRLVSNKDLLLLERILLLSYRFDKSSGLEGKDGITEYWCWEQR